VNEATGDQSLIARASVPFWDRTLNRYRVPGTTTSGPPLSPNVALAFEVFLYQSRQSLAPTR
jgi:hypothetical protein